MPMVESLSIVYREKEVGIGSNNVKTNRTGMEWVKWEYKVVYWSDANVSPDTQVELDWLLKMGNDGWELCGSPLSHEEGRVWLYYMKRQVQDSNTEQKGG